MMRRKLLKLFHYNRLHCWVALRFCCLGRCFPLTSKFYPYTFSIAGVGVCYPRRIGKALRWRPSQWSVFFCLSEPGNYEGCARLFHPQANSTVWAISPSRLFVPLIVNFSVPCHRAHWEAFCVLSCSSLTAYSLEIPSPIKALACL